MIVKRFTYLHTFVLCITFFVMCFMLSGETAYANSEIEIDYVDNGDFSGNVCNKNITLTRNGNLRLDFQELSYGFFTVELRNNNGDIVYSTECDFSFSNKSFVINNLSAGTYSLLLTREDDICDCDLYIYGVYIPDDTYPEFSLSSANLTLEKKQSKSLYIKASPSNVKYSVVWSSNDNKIVSVNNSGTVKANAVGTTKINAKIYLNGKLYDTLACVIKVKTDWKYKDFSSAMKKCAKKNKNLTYKDIDKGRICRLYSRAYLTSSNKHLRSRGYASIAYYVFYIELKKSGDKLSLKLYAENEFIQMDAYGEVELDSDQFKMKYSNRIMNFDLSIVSDKSYYSRKGYYYGKTKSRAVISDASKYNSSKLKKFRTMLGQSSTWYKISCESGAYYSAKLHKKTRKSARAIVDDYKKLIKNF